MRARLPAVCAGLVVANWVGGAAAATNTLWLTDLDVSRVRQTYGKPHADQSMDNRALRVGGVGYARGLGTHADSEFHIDLKGAALRFTAMTGPDDEVGNSRASLRFTIVGDGKVLWRGPIMIAGRQPRAVDLDLTGIRYLSLLVDMADGIDHHDHADWAEAKFHLLDGAKPESLEKVPEANAAAVRKVFEEGRRSSRVP